MSFISRFNVPVHIWIWHQNCVYLQLNFFGSLYLSMIMQSGVNLIIVAFIIAFDVFLNCLYAWNLYYVVKKLPPGIWEDTACSDPGMKKLRAKVLHMVEFVLLTEYIECMVPLMFLFWMWMSILGPNRPFWIGMTEEDISFEQAMQVTYNLLLLCLLQFGSLIFLMIPLQFKCHMPIFKQLSFIFQSDWKLLASTLVYMFLNAAIGRLEHSGYDYTFQFKWLFEQGYVTP